MKQTLISTQLTNIIFNELFIKSINCNAKQYAMVENVFFFFFGNENMKNIYLITRMYPANISFFYYYMGELHNKKVVFGCFDIFYYPVKEYCTMTNHKKVTWDWEKNEKKARMKIKNYDILLLAIHLVM